MKTTRRIVLKAHSDDSGFTLIEVLAAVIIVVIVALSAAGLSINGIQTATAQQREQVAVTIANGAMETVSGWSSALNSGTGVSNLYTGRFKGTTTTPTTVLGAFTTNAAVSGVSQTYAAWDPTATSSSVAALPVVQSPTGTGTSLLAAQNGTNYTLTTLMGTCYEPIAGGACGLAPGYPSTPPTTTPAGYTNLIRVIVIVSWTATAGGSRCTASGCYYEATTLVDPHTELNWVGTL
jgi:prepilin-type N-terminal cleavage/methylation domain-containing protein